MLRIGFEQAKYDFPEASELREAVIIKVGGTITEQTYLIDVSASDDTALIGLDYLIGGGAIQRYTILPDQQSRLFPFETVEDSILEQVERFTVSLENAPEVEPRFETQGTISTTTVCISDRTRKITSNYTCLKVFFLLAFVIGFRETLTNVPEDVGSFIISVAILSPNPVAVDPELTFNIFYSASGTAGIVLVEPYKFSKLQHSIPQVQMTTLPLMLSIFLLFQMASMKHSLL